jgi:hypothetical protein
MVGGLGLDQKAVEFAAVRGENHEEGYTRCIMEDV